MTPDSELTAPGSSTYSSDTLHVGDGTWDRGRDTFLLPNLMGVNFETMRYNGMGNRFREMPAYYTLIVAHGVIAAIVFLGLVPMSVLIVRYYSRWNPFWAFKLHVWCQVLTLLLTTVVFVLGWFAVGPERSLTNPHHGMGLAIYVTVIFQVLWGWLVHKIESKRKRYHVPLKLVVHRWLGRALTIMGIVQIPLGLTLYGSPKVLFILFSLVAFGYLAALFILSYMYDTDGYPTGSELGTRVSGHSDGDGDGDDHHHHYGRWAAAGAAGLGLAEIFRRRRRNTNRNDDYDGSHASYSEEKYSDEEPRRSGWGHKLLKIGAVAGVLALVKKLFARRRNRESDMESGRYRPAHNRSDSMTEESLSRMEDGRRPEPSYMPPHRPPSRAPSRTQSPGSSYYYNSAYLTEDDGGGKSHGIRNAFLGAGALAAVKGLFGRGKKDDEQRRVEEMRRRDREDERLARANSKRRYTGGGYDGQPYRRAASYTATDMSSDVTRPPRGPSYGESGLTAEPVATGAVDTAQSDMPPVPPAHQHTDSDVTPRQHSGHDAADFAAGAAGAAMGEGYAHHRPRSRSNHREQVDSPPVSVKVKMHNDGRHVTLRRLTEEEAAENRDSRRRDRRSSRRRTSSAGSFSGNEGSNDRWRRVEELERQQAEQVHREQEAAAAAAAANNSIAQSGSLPPSSFVPQSHMNPPPPPHPPSTMPYGQGSITSPGTWTGTDASGDYANNRRRRRAERARARQERQGHSVEFT